MYISGAGLSSLIYVRAEYKIKVPNLSDSTQNVCTSCDWKFKKPEFKDLTIKSTKKLAKMNVCNTALLKLWRSGEGCTSEYQFLLSVRTLVLLTSF